MVSCEGSHHDEGGGLKTHNLIWGINVLVYAAADALLHSQYCIKQGGKP